VVGVATVEVNLRCRTGRTVCPRSWCDGASNCRL